MGEGLHIYDENNEDEHAERIPERTEVIAAIERHVEGYLIQRELSDENGLYLLETSAPGDVPGKVMEYTYRRKGRFKSHEELETSLQLVVYEDGFPTIGRTIENYDEMTGKWKNSMQ